MTDNNANKMWGGRFGAAPADVMQEINVSVSFDKVLAPHDIRGSKAHAAMLAEAGIITKSDAREILKGLDQVAAEIANGTFQFRDDLEDVHMNVESRLKELIGAPAGRLHTARSRNDQVATDFRLYVRDAADGLIGGIVMVYFFGVLGFVGIAGMEFGAAVLSMAPFVPGDLIKLVVSVILIVGLWKAYPRAFR